MAKKAFFIAVAMACTVSANAQKLPYLDTSLTSEERAADLCSRLTLEEKTWLMMNGSRKIDRLAIPPFEWWSEGLHGAARNGYATVFPITMAMAASWDEALLGKCFDAVGDELRVKGNIAKKSGVIKRYQGLSVWTPNINIFRDPRWGRGQETYGEDPYLTTEMGLAVVRGLQGPKDSKYYKTLACAKHFAVHSGPEWNRHSFNIENLPERDLWETYIPAFKALIQEGDVAEVMCAYQRIDGQPCCGNNRYLQQILRSDLGFKGMVVSDCGAINDFWIKGRHEVSKDAASAAAKAVLTGTDVECGGNYAQLTEAVKRGEISEADIDVSVKRLLKFRIELGDFDPEEMVNWTKLPASIIASKEHKQLALDMARECITLLQNKNDILPLKEDANIVVIGPNANDSLMLWGNYNGIPTSSVSILQGLKMFGKNVKYVPGCGYTKNEVIESRFNDLYTEDGKRGMKATYWNNINLQGDTAAVAIMTAPINLSNGGFTVFCPGVNLENFSARYEAIFRPTRSETIEFSTSFDDMLRLVFNGDTIINKWKGRENVQKAAASRKVEAGKEYKIQIDYAQTTAMAVMQFDLGAKLKLNDDEIINAAKNADIVIFAGGISPRLEGEEMKVSDPGFKGGDRTSIELPESQRNIIKKLKEAGSRIVMINCSGGAMALTPETENAEAIVQAWYPGESGGQAVAEVLFGKVNPSGHLPITFYKSDNDLPDFLDYTMTNRTYRYFKGEPLFPFGWGLDYSSYSIGKTKYDKKNGSLAVEVSNTGDRDGSAVIQVYISKPDDTEGPIRTLRAYKRVNLAKGETKTVDIALGRNSFEWWDASTNAMRVKTGKFKIETGLYSSDPEMKTINVKIK